eukprot:scaffold24681_cov76-Phaeocystis_antarctica.AAC.2
MYWSQTESSKWSLDSLSFHPRPPRTVEWWCTFSAAQLNSRCIACRARLEHDRPVSVCLYMLTSSAQRTLRRRWVICSTTRGPRHLRSIHKVNLVENESSDDSQRSFSTHSQNVFCLENTRVFRTYGTARLPVLSFLL